MNNIWEFFDDIKEIAYASDMESREIVYMNKAAMEKHGISSIEDIKGKHCYEVFRGNNASCAICGGRELTEGKFTEWRFFNPMLGSYVLVFGTITEINGRKCRFEVTINVGKEDAIHNTLDEYEDLESLVNNGIKFAMSEPNPDKSIDILLEFLGKALGGERAYIFEKNSIGNDDNTYEWTAVGVTPEKDNLQNLPPDVCANWYKNFSENKNIVIEDLEEIRDVDPPLYDILNRQNIHSVVVVPLFTDRKVTGFYGIDNPPKQHMNYALNMLQIVGYFISSTIKRRDMMNELRDMSQTDRLTALGNRYAMDKYISDVSETENIGIVYCDITGLKRANDTYGHKKGDELICRAANILKTAFSGYGLFRIGGDELLALCRNIPEQELAERVKKLREILGEQETTNGEAAVVMAVGSAWGKAGDKNISFLMHEAERLMYEEKSEYYRKSGIDRRK
ncbi:MAG: diguanylate cyclase [Oscillospiraceae bacterium]|nr:diguanylate cyclase [Oscillospiraceae bacterium]